mgnify:CR=1 FL=1
MYVVYQINLGTYATYQEPLYFNDDIDYYYITDDLTYTSSRLKIIYITDKLTEHTLRFKLKDLKWKIYNYIPGYKYYMQVDADQQIIGDLMPLFKISVSKQADIVLFRWLDMSTYYELGQLRRLSYIDHVQDSSIKEMYGQLNRDLVYSNSYYSKLIILTDNDTMRLFTTKLLQIMDRYRVTRDQVLLSYVFTLYRVEVYTLEEEFSSKSRSYDHDTYHNHINYHKRKEYKRYIRKILGKHYGFGNEFATHIETELTIAYWKRLGINISDTHCYRRSSFWQNYFKPSSSILDARGKALRYSHTKQFQLPYYNIKIQLDREVIQDIFKMFRNNTKMLVFGLGYDSKMWYAGNTHTYFIEHNDVYIDLNSAVIPAANIIKYKYCNITVTDSFNINDNDLGKYMLPPALLEIAPFDIILIDGPEGWRKDKPGRLLPCYWTNKFLSKPGTIIYIDDSSRKLEHHCIRRYFKDKEQTLFPRRKGCTKIIY